MVRQYDTTNICFCKCYQTAYFNTKHYYELTTLDNDIFIPQDILFVKTVIIIYYIAFVSTEKNFTLDTTEHLKVTISK